MHQFSLKIFYTDCRHDLCMRYRRLINNRQYIELSRVFIVASKLTLRTIWRSCHRPIFWRREPQLIGHRAPLYDQSRLKCEAASLFIKSYASQFSAPPPPPLRRNVFFCNVLLVGADLAEQVYQAEC